ncbi:S9 family peptidase [Pseudoalteromonas fenneropenaei]|uniref:S9 family peptidase n=1 Tax=Pseudoalteromonas fenneropenaei TaxID=1737459 RepID=A0ABV7CKY8_9GAMM
MSQSIITAPIANQKAHTLSHHGHDRIDNYYWMRDDERQAPEVIAHLEAENRYCEAMLEPSKALQQQVFAELKARIVKDDSSVPVKDGQYWYVSEVAGDNEYPSFCRADNAEMVNKVLLLDVNQLAAGHDFYDLGELLVSPNEEILAYSEDTDSRRIYTVKFKDLNTGALLADELHNTEGQVVWANDNQTVYYVKKDLQTLLGSQVYRHTLGSPQSDDELVYEEEDKQFFLGLGKSRDETQIFIYLSATETTDVLVLAADDSKAEVKRLFARQTGHEFGLERIHGQYFILTNLEAKNFRLMTADDNTIATPHLWQERIAHRDAVLLEGIELFNDQFVMTEREKGQTRFVVHSYQGDSFQLNFNDDCYYAGIGLNPEAASAVVRISYSSLTTPFSIFDVDLVTGQKTLRKQQQVLGEFNSKDYGSERIYVSALDGAEIPVSLVYKKSLFQQDGTNPLLQYGYGAYGITLDPSFSSSVLSLLDRGFVYAIAHVRGSEMLGRQWYEQGKKAHKQNTFSDFITVTRALVAKGYGAKDKIFASGGSAGGLLMGAIVNQAPELYCGVGVHVPFLDVLTTMLDESIPLTTNEYDEWGNPNYPEDYKTILAYSPYDNIKVQAYPNILVTTGLHDSQVQYWEPMKWVAKLRAHKTDDNLLLFKTDMDAGHGGASGRFKSLEEKALEFAFFIQLANSNNV